MSFELLQWVKNIEGLPPPQKIVLVFLADYFNEKEGYAWPSQDRLARETGFNRSTIIRALKELQKKGYISISKTARKSGHFANNRYQIHRVAESHVAESGEAEKDNAVLHKTTSPCGRLQQKPLAKPLDLTLTNSQVSTKERELTENQKRLAQEWGHRLVAKHPGQFYCVEATVRDVEEFLLTSQTEDDWKKIGNGLPNPRSL